MSHKKILAAISAEVSAAEYVRLARGGRFRLPAVAAARGRRVWGTSFSKVLYLVTLNIKYSILYYLVTLREDPCWGYTFLKKKILFIV